jgi:hypothetical protein
MERREGNYRFQSLSKIKEFFISISCLCRALMTLPQGVGILEWNANRSKSISKNFDFFINFSSYVHFGATNGLISTPVSSQDVSTSNTIQTARFYTVRKEIASQKSKARLLPLHICPSRAELYHTWCTSYDYNLCISKQKFVHLKKRKKRTKSNLPDDHFMRS